MSLLPERHDSYNKPTNSANRNVVKQYHRKINGVGHSKIF